jgi:signal transduction histidine kinase
LLAFLRYREKLSVKVQSLQEDALSAEKMKTEFLGLINHEIRTPLNGIIGISDAMIHHAPNPTMRAQAEIVQESGQLLFDLLDSLITMSTIEGNRLTLDKEEDILAKTIRREVAEWDNAAAKKGLTFTHFIGAELEDAVITDHKRIRQSLHYLLSNAIRFTQVGRVHLHATATQDANGHLNVTIVVADTGQGISDDVQSRLFQPFLQADATMTRKYGGAGLSLAIARKLARMMRGDLVVKSREGRGTEFTFTARIPLAEPAAHTLPDDRALAPTAPLLLTLDDIEEPEEIIDLMLSEQLLGASPVALGETGTQNYKAAG